MPTRPVRYIESAEGFTRHGFMRRSGNATWGEGRWHADSALGTATDADVPTPVDTAVTGWQIDRSEQVQVTCWCERKMVMCSIGEVLAGTTHTCGRRDCVSPLVSGAKNPKAVRTEGASAATFVA